MTKLGFSFYHFDVSARFRLNALCYRAESTECVSTSQMARDLPEASMAGAAGPALRKKQVGTMVLQRCAN